MAALAAVACTGCATGLTGSPRYVGGTEAQLFGAIVSTTGDPVEYWAEYGRDASYGSESAHATWPFALEPYRPETVLVPISGLQRDTAYHWRLCAKDAQQSGGPGCGEDRTFTTPNVDCGDVLTHDLTLSARLDCPDSVGLVVGAAGLDINLNGHAVSGPADRRPQETSGTGIDNTGGYDDVTVRNGAVVRWGTALQLDSASFNVIRNVDMAGGGGSVFIHGGESNTIRSTVMTGSIFGAGLFARDTEGLVVADSSGDQWRIVGSGARIVRNDLADGPRFSTCLSVAGNNNQIADNQVLGCPNGSIVIESGANNELIGNEASGAWTYADPDAPDGIRVEAFTAGTLLQDNFVHGNDDDGIEVRATSARLRGNRADGNGDFGIDARAGVTDLGANTASGNGNPLQCRNVFCP